MPQYTHAAHNPVLDVLVKWDDDGQFVIIGDDSQITDRTLANLVKGTFPAGWRKAPLTPAEIIASVESPTRQHTPGPWESNHSGSYWSILGPDRNLHGEGITSMPVAAVVQTNPEALANAKLIAAAPDLLAALVQFIYDIETWEDQGRDWDMVTLAKDAIEKATGKRL